MRQRIEELYERHDKVSTARLPASTVDRTAQLAVPVFSCEQALVQKILKILKEADKDCPKNPAAKGTVARRWVQSERLVEVASTKAPSSALSS